MKFSTIIDFIIIALFIFYGIKYLKTRQFDDKKNKYTEESKEKAAVAMSIMFFISAIFLIVMAVLNMKGILITDSGDDFLLHFFPYLILLGFIVIYTIIIYAVILKKK